MSRDTTTATGGDLSTLRSPVSGSTKARQLWRDAGGPLDAPERIPAGSTISGVCGAAGRTARRDQPAKGST